MTTSSPEIVPYPNQRILRSLDRQSFESVISSWSTLVQYYISQNDEYPPSLITFVESYVREIANELKSSLGKPIPRVQSKGKNRSKTPAESNLRAGIFVLITKNHVVTQPSPEFLWDFISLYGPTNVHRTAEYINYVRKSNSVSLPKLCKLALHLIEKTGDDNEETQNHILQTIGVLLSDAELTKSILTDKWFNDLYGNGSDFALKVASLCQTGLSLNGQGQQQSRQNNTSNAKPEDISLLLDLFPALTIQAASDVLNSHSNVETASSYLLENPSAIQELLERDHVNSYGDNNSDSDDEEIKKYQPLKKNVSINKDTAALEATLRLIYEADDDERDDTYDDAPHTEEEAKSTLALQKIEKYLWDAYHKTPALFHRDSRKSRQRNEIKKITNWTDEQVEGWARILEKNPRRRAYLEERFMFQGNRPHMRSVAFRNNDNDNDESPASASTADEDEEEEEEEDTSLHNAANTSSGAGGGFKIQQNKNTTGNTTNTSNDKAKTKSQRQRSDKYKSIARQRQKDKHTKKMGLE